jgi:hypothetical protein
MEKTSALAAGSLVGISTNDQWPSAAGKVLWLMSGFHDAEELGILKVLHKSYDGTLILTC